jgi:hypothetical protein
MEPSAQTISMLGILATVVAIVALGMAAAAMAAQRRVRQAYRIFSGDSRDDVLTLLQRHVEQVGQLREEVGRQQRSAEQLRSLIGGCLSRVATVRFDAFDDMGGRLSFCVALLDEHGNGTVITAINGRTETRAYAKPVIGGESSHTLSQEEVDAIRQALASGKPSRRERTRTAKPHPPHTAGEGNVAEERETPVGQTNQ